MRYDYNFVLGRVIFFSNEGFILIKIILGLVMLYRKFNISLNADYNISDIAFLIRHAFTFSYRLYCVCVRAYETMFKRSSPAY
jgi:hypothetical protein